MTKGGGAPHTETIGPRTKTTFRNGPFTLKFTGRLDPKLKVTCDDPDALDPTDALLAVLKDRLPGFSQTQCINFFWHVLLSADGPYNLDLGNYTPWEYGYREAGGPGMPLAFACAVDRVFQRYLDGEEEEDNEEEEEDDSEEEKEMAEGWEIQEKPQWETARKDMVAAYQAAGRVDRDASSKAATKGATKAATAAVASTGSVVALDSVIAAAMGRGVSVNMNRSTNLEGAMASDMAKMTDTTVEMTGTAGALSVFSAAAGDAAKMIIVNELVLTAAQGAEDLFGKSEHYPAIFKTPTGKQLLGVLMLLSILGLTMYMPGILPASMQSKRVQEMIRYGLQAAMVALIGPVVAHLNPLTKRVENLSEQFDR